MELSGGEMPSGYILAKILSGVGSSLTVAVGSASGFVGDFDFLGDFDRDRDFPRSSFAFDLPRVQSEEGAGISVDFFAFSASPAMGFDAETDLALEETGVSSDCRLGSSDFCSLEGLLT